jgi:nitric oxide reductase activation protein
VVEKLLLLVSDGEPADIDVRDPQYLRHDTKKAVEYLNGISTYYLTLDPQADDYVSRIFVAVIRLWIMCSGCWRNCRRCLWD